MSKNLPFYWRPPHFVLSAFASFFFPAVAAAADAADAPDADAAAAAAPHLPSHGCDLPLLPLSCPDLPPPSSQPGKIEFKLEKEK